ncbi:hypothetical protein [Actinosynnema sp. NPDC020468]|uniref:hypothetical protein n=1 Tax=Actinosynnema sp. NPDC020468 TaxID=3154488 RepID=UPI0033EE51B8
MTTVTRSAAGPLRHLPLMLPVFLLALVIALIPVASSRFTDGLIRVDTPQFSLSHGDIPCADSGTTVTCTVQLAGKPLELISDVATFTGSCEATYGGERVSCRKSSDYGLVRPWLYLGPVAVPADVAADLRSDFPWYRDLIDLNWMAFGLILTGVLAVLATVGAVLWSRRPREVARLRTVRTLVTAAVAWALALVAQLLLGPEWRHDTAWAVLFIPHSVIVPVLLVVVWQWACGGEVTGTPGQRFRHGLIAFVATVPYTAWSLLLIGINAGVPD